MTTDKVQSVNKFVKRWLPLFQVFAIICAFLAFCISLRQKEIDRFSTIKPIFAISSDSKKNEFSLRNYGGNVVYLGTEDKTLYGPRQYSELPTFKDCDEKSSPCNNEAKFGYPTFNNHSSWLYWSDTDLNTYKMKIAINNRDNEYWIAGIPSAKRSDSYFTMPWQWLDRIFNFCFPKNWFQDFQKPDLNKLHSRTIKSDRENN